MKQKLLLLFVCLLSAVSAWAGVGAVFTASVAGFTTLKYQVLTEEEGNHTCMLAAEQNVVTGEVRIPSTVTYNDISYKVTKIGSMAFVFSETITSVSIPSTVTVIESWAFNSTGIRTVNFETPSSLTTIEEYVFIQCTLLSSITLPNSLTTIGDGAFYNCKGLTSLTIPSSVTSIGSDAFNSCEKLVTLKFEGGNPELANGTFTGIPTTTQVMVEYGDLEFIAKLRKQLGLDENGKINITHHLLEDGKDYAHTSSFVHTEYQTITWKRTFEKDCWQGLCLPFELSKEEWSTVGTVAELTGASGSELQWTILDGPTTAGKPYIFKPNSKNLEVEMDLTPRPILGTSDWDEVISVTKDGYTVTGTYAEKTDMGDGKTYALYNGDFYFTNSNAKTLKPYRIFLTIATPTPMEAPIRNVIIGSGIENPEGDGPTSIDGLVIDGVDDAPAFNLHGQRVGADYKGIVIVNGRKVVRR